MVDLPSDPVDVLVIGSGMAGLVTALLVDERLRVLVVTKKGRADSNTNFAQGGLAAAVGDDDSPVVHLVDTLRTGAGLCHPGIVRGVVEDGPGVIRRLREWGVSFSTTPEGGLDLGREGGHTRRRIVHSLDRTGEEIERTLLARVRGSENISVVENALAVEVLTDVSPLGSIRACGVELLLGDLDDEHRVVVHAHGIIVATGGAGQVYQFTSNPEIATGDGIAMGFRCGASVSNLEFVQFHPTTFYSSDGDSFLISEAVRGEGGTLVLPDGSAFMHLYDARKELAPRDIVARAIDNEMKTRNLECVFLDATGIDPDYARRRFPAIYGKCLDVGIDFTRERIPVVPAAHYFCGGLTTDAYGATAVPGLFACGEVACTGLHGANRLASNSLLEAIVFATRVASAMTTYLSRVSTRPLPPPECIATCASDECSSRQAADLRRLVRQCMWKNVGIVRSDQTLATALETLAALERTILSLVREAPSREALETRNLVRAARLVALAGSWRMESRGLHFNVDHPHRGGKTWRRDSLIAPPLD